MAENPDNPVLIKLPHSQDGVTCPHCASIENTKLGVGYYIVERKETPLPSEDEGGVSV